MNLRLRLGGKTLQIDNVVLANNWLKFRGLMFRNRNNSPNILFNLRSSIHSFFVLFDFLVVWLDEENNVLDYKIVKPFSLNEKSNKGFSKILEIPLNLKNKRIYDFIVGRNI